MGHRIDREPEKGPPGPGLSELMRAMFGGPARVRREPRIHGRLEAFIPRPVKTYSVSAEGGEVVMSKRAWKRYRAMRPSTHNRRRHPHGRR